MMAANVAAPANVFLTHPQGTSLIAFPQVFQISHTQTFIIPSSYLLVHPTLHDKEVRFRSRTQ